MKNPGWIGAENICKFPEYHELKNGATPTPFEAMQMGVGMPTNIEYWSVGWRGPQKDFSTIFDPVGSSAWIQTPIKEGKYYVNDGNSGCIWANHGVWDRNTRKPLRKNYFSVNPKTNKKIDFLEDFFKPFTLRFTAAIRAVHTTAIIFIEPPVNEHCPKWDDKSSRMALAPHWYDGLTRKKNASSTL